MYKVGDKIKFTDVSKIAFGRDLTKGKVYEVVKFGYWDAKNDYFFVIDDLGTHMVIIESEYQYTKKVGK